MSTIARLLGSASKLVFLILTLSACMGFHTGRLSEGNFMILVSSAFAFYFGSKGEMGQPFAGK